jgi:ankyrin repeat protein
MAYFPTHLTPVTSRQTTPQGTPSKQTSPPQRALAETAGPLVRHDDPKLIELNWKLLQASEEGHHRRIKEAIESGADPNLLVPHLQRWKGTTIPVLAYAAMCGDTGLVECLLKRGATLQKWMVMDALYPGRAEVLRIFADYADIHTPDPSDGWTPLHTACRDHDAWAVGLLIHLGADVNGKTKDGNLTPLAIACSYDNCDAIYVLLHRRANTDLAVGDTLRHWMTMDTLAPKREEVIRAFAKFVGIDTPDPSDGSTLLHWACRHDNVEAVNLLIELGADVNASMNDGSTCLFQACVARCHQIAIMKRLLDEGAQIERKLGNVTPLAHACSLNNHAVVSYLLNRGAKWSRALLDVICRPHTDLRTFGLVIESKPKLHRYALHRLLDRQDEVSMEKKNFMSSAVRPPIIQPDKRMPRQTETPSTI